MKTYEEIKEDPGRGTMIAYASLKGNGSCGHLVPRPGKTYIVTMDAAAILTDEEVRTALAALKERLQPLLGDSLARLVLYGSRARGDADPDSDVDVAIVVRGADGKIRDRILDAVADVELDTGVPLSTLVFSEAEFQRLLAGERMIALDIDREGVSL